jgi:poly-gamma-glutamate synthesis protein (capsule biosynthesis protein)
MKCIVSVLTACAIAVLVMNAVGESRASKERFTLAFTGDVMLGRGVDEVIHFHGPSYPLGNTAPLLAQADLALVNLECVIASGGRMWMSPPRRFYFRANPLAVGVLQQAGIDYVTLANNHSLDFGAEALLETFRHLKEAGIRWAGAGKNLQEAKQPALLKVGDLAFAVFAGTDNFPEYGAGTRRPGTWHLEIPPSEKFFEELRSKITRLRKEGIDFVVFSLHWGPNMVEAPPAEFQDFAHRLVDLGVDIVHGHSAHVFQGIEIYRGKIIFYDTGDFVDDYYVTQAIDEQFLYRVHGESGRLKEIELIPVKIANYQVNLADQKTAKRTVERMRHRSAPFGTEILEIQGRWVIRVG